MSSIMLIPPSGRSHGLGGVDLSVLRPPTLPVCATFLLDQNAGVARVIHP